LRSGDVNKYKENKHKARSSYKTNAINDESCIALRRNQTDTITHETKTPSLRKTSLKFEDTKVGSEKPLIEEEHTMNRRVKISWVWGSIYHG
jgi:uncharacterized protein YtpQ (UPF0354 family)